MTEMFYAASSNGALNYNFSHNEYEFA
jgi:hypothetical protein